MLRRALVLAALAGSLAAPAAAPADAFDDVLADYRRDARIDPCAHTEEELRAARRDVPADIEQYAPDFPAALDEALEARARSGCAGDGGDAAPAGADRVDALGTATPEVEPAPAAAAPAEAAPAATTAAAPGAVPQPPGTARVAAAAADSAIVAAAAREVDTGGDAPAPLLVLAVVGGLALLGLLAWALARFFAWDPEWVRATRHAIAEAGWRTGAAWEDFRDWLRGGRSTSAR